MYLLLPTQIRVALVKAQVRALMIAMDSPLFRIVLRLIVQTRATRQDRLTKPSMIQKVSAANNLKFNMESKIKRNTRLARLRGFL